MQWRAAAAGGLAAVLLAACAPQTRVPEPPAPPPPAPPVSAAPVPVPAPIVAAPAVSPFTLEGYKKRVAGRIAVHNPDANDSPLPPMLKSIVVLEITIDRLGNPIEIAVYRSNGFRHLETRALESVVRAAPFELPALGVLQGGGSVTFLETFLFRGDDSFQIRSLVSAPAARG